VSRRTNHQSQPGAPARGGICFAKDEALTVDFKHKVVLVIGLVLTLAWIILLGWMIAHLVGIVN
jgi:hypothetical protein